MDGIETLVAEGLISASDALKLASLQPGAYCIHKSWGFGTVAELDINDHSMVINFEGKSSHKMELSFAVKSLTPLASNHILVRRRTDLPALQKQSQSDAVNLMAQVISDLCTEATVATIESTLCPLVVPTADWKKWWDAAKKEMRKDGRFTIPKGKSDIFKALDAAPDRSVNVEDLKEVKGLSPLLQKATDLIKNSDVWSDKKEELKPFIEQVETALKNSPGNNKSDFIKLAIARDTLAEIIGMQPNPDTATSKLVVTYEVHLSPILASLPSSSQKRILKAIHEAEPHTWAAAMLKHLSHGSGRLVEQMMEYFEEHDMKDAFMDSLRSKIREQALPSEVMIWIIKNRKKVTKSLVEPRIFSALVAAIERDQIGDHRSTKLHDLVVSDKPLLDIIRGNETNPKIIQDAVRDITRQLILTAVFDDMNKRSLLAQIIKEYPEMQQLVVASGEKSKSSYDSEIAAATPDKLIVSWESLERRKAELDEIVNKKIPANVREIEVARSYGDLRENAEFKFAKEQQGVLSRQRAELESDLMRSEGNDFSHTDTSKVNIGCIVALDDNGSDQSYTILGAWDSNPEKDIISYLTPMAKSLMGKKVGDTISVSDGHVQKTLKLKSISAYKP